MKSLFVVLLSLICYFHGNAQESASWRLDLQGYNVVFPGIQIAREFPVWTLNREVGEGKSHLMQLRVAPTAEVYFYKGNHTGFGLNGEASLTYRFANDFGVFLYGSMGALASVLAGEVFEQNPDGTFTSGTKGNLYSQWSTGFGFGKSLMKSHNKPLCINIRAGVRQANFPATLITPNVSLSLNWYTSK